MKGYKIDFDLGEIAYFEDHDLIQVYRFHSFYSGLRLEQQALTSKKLLEIDFNSLIYLCTSYFSLLYDVCEMVSACHLLIDEILTLYHG